MASTPLISLAEASKIKIRFAALEARCAEVQNHVKAFNAELAKCTQQRFPLATSNGSEVFRPSSPEVSEDVRGLRGMMSKNSRLPQRNPKLESAEQNGIFGFLKRASTSTSVGYGDKVVTSRQGMLFTSCYVLGTVLVVSVIASRITDWLLEEQGGLLKEGFEGVIKHISKQAGGMHSKKHVETPEQTCLEGYLQHRFLRDFVRSLAIWIFVLFIGVSFFMYYPGENKTFIEAFYMCVVTLTTVGFGDVTASTYGGKVFAAFWMFLGVACLADVGAKIASWMIHRKIKARITSFQQNHTLENIFNDDYLKLCMEDHKKLKRLEQLPNQYVWRSDFIVHMLTQSDVVDNDLVDDLSMQFDRLDKSGDSFLSAEDVASYKRLNGSVQASKIVEKFASV